MSERTAYIMAARDIAFVDVTSLKCQNASLVMESRGSRVCTPGFAVGYRIA